MFTEALSLWADEHPCVALSAENLASWFHCALVDDCLPADACEIELAKREPSRTPAGESR